MQISILKNINLSENVTAVLFYLNNKIMNILKKKK